MRVKISLEQFNIIKNQLNKLIEHIIVENEKLYEEENTNIDEYFNALKPLLEYDLSDIPFEAWQGMVLGSKDKFDLSGTNANIDFSLLKEFNCDELIAYGCNLRNLDKVDCKIYSSNFDQATISQFPNIFFSSEFPENIKEKYEANKLNLEDLLSLTESQLKELETKERRKNLEEDFKLYLDLSFKDIIDLYRAHPDFFKYRYNTSDSAIPYKLEPHLLSALAASDRTHPDFDIDKVFSKAIGNYIVHDLQVYIEDLMADGSKDFNIPKWLKSFDFNVIEKLESIENFNSINNKTLILNTLQHRVISVFGIENLQQFEKEYHFFSHKRDDSIKELAFFNVIAEYLASNDNEYKLEKMKIDTYEQFQDKFANLLLQMKESNIFTDYPNYDFVNGNFRDKYSHLFISSDAPDELKDKFYKHNIKPIDLKNNPDWIPFLIGKDLRSTFRTEFISSYFNSNEQGVQIIEKFNFMEFYIKNYGDEAFLNLIAQYGITICNLENHVFDISLDKEGIDKKFREIIYKNIISNKAAKYDEDMPQIFKDEYPELFISSMAPHILKNFFYRIDGPYDIDFSDLNKSEWLPYLKGKFLSVMFLDSSFSEEYTKYFNFFGENALNIAMKKPDTIKEMITNRKVELLRNWYLKTGKMFIPDITIMNNFPFEKADDFLANGKIWSKLNQNQKWSKQYETKEVLLKLAYSFGVFDYDSNGIKKLEFLLKKCPTTLNAANFDKLDSIVSKSDSYEKDFLTDIITTEILKLKELMISENLVIDNSPTFLLQFYEKDINGNYKLILNSEKYPKTSEKLRELMEIANVSTVLTPGKAQQFFGGFSMKYDPDFREFLLNNIERILSSPEHARFISSIQRQFSSIKAINSNRTLTFDLALSYVKSNKFKNVNDGNEKLSEISSIAGYSQEDFKTLQQIYNIGKARTFSSIPRVEKVVDKYAYEILRLDDPLALAIGTLTDCCQELNNVAETCVEHSMIDKNGRVFVIKNHEGNIIAQSWVWRNKNVVCFDNIEIPNKAFNRAKKEDHENGRKVLAEDVFNLYKMAAHDLIEEDERIYKKLLEEGKITQEQYDGLRISKVTVGLGYNDIAEQIKNNTIINNGKNIRPLGFITPIPLSRGLYIGDSRTQYILEDTQNSITYKGETLAVHSDKNLEYSDQNMNMQQLLTLQKLEILTKKNVYRLKTSLSDDDDKNKIVSSLASNYGLNPDNTRIIMNPNFAIIFERSNKMIKVADLLFNTKVDNGDQQIDITREVEIQIRNAFNQLSSEGKTININYLDDNKQKMFEKVMNLSEEIDIERGISHGSK